MTGRIVVLFAVLSASLAGQHSLAADETASTAPQIIEPEQRLRSVEQRLDRIESLLEGIQQHLGLAPRRPVKSNGTIVFPVPGRLDRLDSESATISAQLADIQKQLDERKPEAKPLEPIPAQGKLVIRNWTGVSQYLLVNRVRFLVSPGRTEIEVPYATVEAYLPGFEIPRLLGMSNWRRTERGYEILFDIKI